VSAPNASSEPRDGIHVAERLDVYVAAGRVVAVWHRDTPLAFRQLDASDRTPVPGCRVKRVEVQA
jgi:hypothetical protein